MPDVHFHRDEWFEIVECVECGLGFVNPRPEFREMEKYYPGEFFAVFEEHAEAHALRYAREADYLRGITASGRILLDIGCANGDFPRYMKRLGWRVEGVEIGSNANPIADFPVYRTAFSELPLGGPHYDAITAWAVLEHVHDPMAYFIKAGELLKPGGLFVFLVTNFHSLSSRRLFREDPPRHLYFFTEPTVINYLERGGLELTRADYNGDIFEMRPVGWLRYHLYRFLFRRTLMWRDIPDNRMEFLTRNGLPNDLLSNLRYVITHPLTVLDRLLMPIYEKYQLSSASYGTATYVARKPD